MHTHNTQNFVFAWLSVSLWRAPRGMDVIFWMPASAQDYPISHGEIAIDIRNPYTSMDGHHLAWALVDFCISKIK